MKMSDVNQAYCWVQKNSFGKIAIQSTVSGNSLDSYFVSSNSVILHLDVGDAIDIGGCTSIDTIYDATETSFTGFLLKAD